MTDTIKDLDAAVAGKEAATKFVDEHPDAPPWAVELAKEIKANEAALDREEQRRKQRRETVRTRLQAAVAETKGRIAVMAAKAGVATKEEERILEKASEQDTDEQSRLGALFNPSNTE